MQPGDGAGGGRAARVWSSRVLRGGELPALPAKTGSSATGLADRGDQPSVAALVPVSSEHQRRAARIPAIRARLITRTDHACTLEITIVTRGELILEKYC